MGNFIFRLPDVGEGIAEAEIVAWHVDVGDTVKEDAPLVDVMTDKATVEIGAPVAGKIIQRKGAPGQMSRVGDELVVIETAGGREANAPAPAERPSVKSAPAPAEASRPPAVATRPIPTSAAGQPGRAIPASSHGKVLASPAVRARAIQLGIDLSTVRGSGDGGRIEHGDLDALLSKPRRGSMPIANGPADGVQDIPVIGLRRQIATAMLESKRRIPHFAYVEEIDVTALEELRATLNQRFAGSRPKLTLLPFIITAMVRAIAVHPGVNAHYDDEGGIIRRYAAVHMGVATQTPRGLVVPVVRNAEGRDLWSIATETDRLATAARAGKATREELSGSTVTVSSLGALGGIAATPIIKWPEVAVVGVNKIVERPVVVEGRIEVRKMMNLSSSFDHRVVDGYDAAEFIQAVKSDLETPAQLFLE